MAGSGKPTVQDLGLNVDALSWQASGDGPEQLEVAFAGDWVLLRVGGGDGRGQVLVFDHNEWDCFVRGVKDGEFDSQIR